jgi:transcriptional regulator GlxA family with amidase domain
MPSAVVLVFDNCNATSVAAFVDVLTVANQLWLQDHLDAAPLFSWQLASPDGGAIATSAGMRLTPDGPPPRAQTDIVYVPACHFTTEARLLREVNALADELRPWLLRQHRGGAWMTAGCSGGFVLGRCGLLDGKIATTSWWLAALFEREFPRAKLRKDELVTAGDRLLCAGPVNAHFNLALRVVESFAGNDLALRCAKLLLVDANRVSQRPYVLLQEQLRHTDEMIVRGQEWMRRHLLEDDFSIETLARALGASPRNLVRRWKRANGSTPVAYLQDLRIELAKNLLETTDLGLDAIVDKVGYSDGASFRRLFRQKTALSPRAYRERFAVGRAARRAAAPARRLRGSRTAR